MSAPDDPAPVPRLPRGRGFKLSMPQLLRIGMTLILLIAIVIMRKPCADSVSRFVTGFGNDQGSAGTAMPKPGNVDRPATGAGVGSAGDYVQLRGDMSEAEVKAAVDEAHLKAAAKDWRPSPETIKAMGEFCALGGIEPSKRPARVDHWVAANKSNRELGELWLVMRTDKVALAKLRIAASRAVGSNSCDSLLDVVSGEFKPPAPIELHPTSP